MKDLNDTLYEKMAAEQDTFRDWLKSQSPEEVLNHAYEYTVREDILMAMEDMELTDAQAKALLASPTPLSDVFRDFQKTETDHMETIRDCIESRADDMVKREQTALLNTPVYLHTGAYAREHDELDAYRASYRANIACKEAIDHAIQENFDGSHLDLAKIYETVAPQFSTERMELVLANTVQHKDWDHRFSYDIRAWAQGVQMEDSFGSRENDRSTSYVLVSHSVLADAFVKHFCKELARKESILEKLQKPLPAVPNKTGKEPSHER